MQTCKTCGTPSDIRVDGSTLGIPFLCKECGGPYIGLRPLRDLVYLWPIIPDTYVKGGRIVIPEIYRTDLKQGFGFVLGCGKGWYDRKNRFHPNEYLHRGTLVSYDKHVPWFYHFVGEDGQEHPVTICGFGDVKAELDAKEFGYELHPCES